MDSKKFRLVLLIVILVIGFDQITKIMILKNLTTGSTLPVIPGLFNLVLTFNRGVAFGFMSAYPEELRLALLTLTTVLALGAIAYFFFREYAHDFACRVALAMIFGGAVGNIIDRIRIGMVVDFLDFYWGPYHWPAFNVADSAICLGVAVLLLRRPKNALVTAS